MNVEVHAHDGSGSVYDTSGGCESQGGFERWCREFGCAQVEFVHVRRRLGLKGKCVVVLNSRVFQGTLSLIKLLVERTLFKAFTDLVRVLRPGINRIRLHSTHPIYLSKLLERYI